MRQTILGRPASIPEMISRLNVGIVVISSVDDVPNL